MSRLIKKSLFDPEVYGECINRINRLTEHTIPQWGTMDAAQMLAHCAEVLEVMNGKDLNNTPVIVRLFKPLVRHMVVNIRAYSEGTRTHPQYIQDTERVFEFEKRRLLNALKEFITRSVEEANSVRHPLLGKMSFEDRDWSMYKHLDHHLRQFGL